MYAAIGAEAVLLVWGLEAFVSARVALPCLVVGIAALDLYGMHALLMPYCTGFTVHVGDNTRPVLPTAMTHLPVIFDRLARLRPSWLSVAELFAVYVGYLVATVAAAFAVVLLFREPAPDL